MTNDHEGLTFMIKSWVLDPDVVSGKKPSRHTHRYYDHDEYVIEETPFVVSNGKWVLEESLICGRWSRLVGIDHSELEQVTLRYEPYEVLSIGNRPFGYVCVDEDDFDRSVYPNVVKPNRRKTLVYARQVHKGELGRGVPTPMLDYIRQPLESHRGLGMKTRERRHGQYGWVKLADLGELTVGYRPDKQVELILGYWQFSGHRNYPHYKNDQVGGQLVDVAWGSSLDIELGNAEFKSLTREQFLEECSDTSEVWIRRGFAYTILRLHVLGVQPEVVQPA